MILEEIKTRFGFQARFVVWCNITEVLTRTTRFALCHTWIILHYTITSNKFSMQSTNHGWSEISYSSHGDHVLQRNRRHIFNKSRYHKEHEWTWNIFHLLQLNGSTMDGGLTFCKRHREVSQLDWAICSALLTRDLKEIWIIKDNVITSDHYAKSVVIQLEIGHRHIIRQASLLGTDYIPLANCRVHKQYISECGGLVV